MEASNRHPLPPRQISRQRRHATSPANERRRRLGPGDYAAINKGSEQSSSHNSNSHVSKATSNSLSRAYNLSCSLARFDFFRHRKSSTTRLSWNWCVCYRPADPLKGQLWPVLGCGNLDVFALLAIFVRTEEARHTTNGRRKGPITKLGKTSNGNNYNLNEPRTRLKLTSTRLGMSQLKMEDRAPKTNSHSFCQSAVVRPNR